MRIKASTSTIDGVENRINHENCHPNVVRQRRKNEMLTLDFLFLDNTKKPIEMKNREITRDGK